MVNETSENTNAVRLRNSEAKEALNMLEGWLTKLDASNPNSPDIGLGIHTQISTALNVGSALFLCWPDNWSSQSKEEMQSYGDQVSLWIRNKLVNLATREEVNRKAGTQWAIDKNSEDSLK